MCRPFVGLLIRTEVSAFLVMQYPKDVFRDSYTYNRFLYRQKCNFSPKIESLHWTTALKGFTIAISQTSIRLFFPDVKLELLKNTPDPNWNINILSGVIASESLSRIKQREHLVIIVLDSRFYLPHLLFFGNTWPKKIYFLG